MRVRALSAAGDMTFGQGGQNFLVNSPECVGQVCETRLRLLLGEFFLDITDGTAWQTGVLGMHTAQTRDIVLRDRILGTPNLTDIASYSSSANPNTRAFTVSATVDTAFGQTTVSATS